MSRPCVRGRRRPTEDGRIIARCWEIASILVFASIAVACQTPAPDGVSVQTAPKTLESAVSKPDLLRFVGEEPHSCVATGWATQLCAWRRVGKTSGAWPQLAQLASSSQRVNLLCELPLDGSPRASGSCSVHECQAAAWSSGFEEGSPQAMAEARARLDAAPDIVALSRLVGDGPVRCMRGGPRNRLCSWSVTSASQGWEVFAAASGLRSRLRLVCELPANGEARAPDSCSIARAR